jgi:chemotaxis protein histidine kinase CheA
MTEEQRMEEGRRMFQIFAARMFEQRVLTAYREKVAEQRQELLLQELLEEQNLNEQRNAKKAREAQKKKDKKKQQRQAREEEKARREAEKAAEEAAARALEEQKLEEQRRKREELRKKKEAEKKAQEEERLRKEAEKQKRLQEERERQAELERKQREQKERERKKREEARKKEREEREAKEKEMREKKAKEERDRKTREEQAKREKEAARAEQEERANRESHAAPPSQPAGPGAKRTSQPGPVTIAMPPGLQHPQGASAVHSPLFQVATPIVPKAPTPARPRQPSQQGSHASSPRSQTATGTEPLSSISPQTLPLSQSSGTPTSTSGKIGLPHQPVLHHPQPSAPLSPLGGVGRSHPLGFPTINGLPSHPPPGMSGMAPRPALGHENIPLYPPHSGPMGTQFRGFPAPNGIPLPPGINSSRPMPLPGRGFPLETGLPFSGQQPVPGPISATQPTGRTQQHSRQTSGSFERSPLDTQAQTLPISRPAPIKRPSSPTALSPQKGGDKSDVDGLSAQLGSSALLDDTDIPFTSNLSQSLPGAPPISGPFGPSRASFGASPLFPDPLGGKCMMGQRRKETFSLTLSAAPKHPSFSGPGSTWSTQGPFGVPGFAGASTWGAGTGPLCSF